MLIAQVDEGAAISAFGARAYAQDDDMLIAQVDQGAIDAAISARRDDAFGAAIPMEMLEQSTRGPPLPPGFREADVEPPGGLTPMVVDSS
eukprot:scaffold105770_cov18-Phaeocystis_antarctica.AAC.1